MAQEPPSQPRTGQPSTVQRWVRSVPIPWAIATAVLLIFIVQNTKDVTFSFLVASFTWPLWVYTIVVAVFGAIAWFGFGVMRRRRRRKERRAERA